MGRPGQGGLVQRDAPPCRRRKVRSAPFPCTAKTAPAPLHPKGTSAPTPWAWALLLSPPCGARRDPLSVLPKEKRAVHGPKRKAPGCALVQWPSALKGGRRIGACSDLDWPSGTLCSSAIPVAAVPWRMAPTSSGGLSHGAASLFATAHAPAKNPAARSAAERAEREADQMRPCTPLTFAPAPRESAFKPVPHPAAPVGRSSQTRRHHLSSTPVQQLCTDVQSCDQKRFFSYTGRGAFSFWR